MKKGFVWGCDQLLKRVIVNETLVKKSIFDRVVQSLFYFDGGFKGRFLESFEQGLPSEADNIKKKVSVRLGLWYKARSQI